MGLLSTSLTFLTKSQLNNLLKGQCAYRTSIRVNWGLNWTDQDIRKKEKRLHIWHQYMNENKETLFLKKKIKKTYPQKNLDWGPKVGFCLRRAAKRSSEEANHWRSRIKKAPRTRQSTMSRNPTFPAAGASLLLEATLLLAGHASSVSSCC